MTGAMVNGLIGAPPERVERLHGLALMIGVGEELMTGINPTGVGVAGVIVAGTPLERVVKVAREGKDPRVTPAAGLLKMITGVAGLLVTGTLLQRAGKLLGQVMTGVDGLQAGTHGTAHLPSQPSQTPQRSQVSQTPRFPQRSQVSQTPRFPRRSRVRASRFPRGSRVRARQRHLRLDLRLSELRYRNLPLKSQQML